MTSKLFSSILDLYKNLNPVLPIVSGVGGEEFYIKTGIQKINSNGKEKVIIDATKNNRGVYVNMNNFYNDLSSIDTGSVFVRFDYEPNKIYTIMYISSGYSDHSPIPTPKSWPTFLKIWTSDRSYKL